MLATAFSGDFQPTTLTAIERRFDSSSYHRASCAATEDGAFDRCFVDTVTR
jgi:hypothetical protein